MHHLVPEVCRSLRRGDNADVQYFIDMFPGTYNPSDLQSHCLHIWTSLASHKDPDTDVLLLRLLLRTPNCSTFAIDQCIRLLTNESLNMKQSSQCASVIRTHLLSLLHSSAKDKSSSSILALRSAAHNAPLSSITPHQLNIISPIITAALSIIHKEDPDKFASLLTDVLSSDWLPASIPALLNILLDIHMTISHYHNQQLMMKLLICVPSIQPDDLISTVRTALRFAEHRTDMNWIRIMRVLYSSINSSLLSTAESLIEQMLPLSQLARTAIPSVAEDDAVMQIRREIIRNPFLLHHHGEDDNSSDECCRWINRGDLSVVVSDVQLLLLMRRSSSLMDESSLMTSNSSDKHIHRATVTCLLKLIAVSISSDYKEHIPFKINSKVIRKHIEDVVLSVLSPCLGSVSLDDTSFISHARACSLTQTALYICIHPVVFSACFNLIRRTHVNICMEDLVIGLIAAVFSHFNRLQRVIISDITRLYFSLCENLTNSSLIKKQKSLLSSTINVLCECLDSVPDEIALLMQELFDTILSLSVENMQSILPSILKIFSQNRNFNLSNVVLLPIRKLMSRDITYKHLVIYSLLHTAPYCSNDEQIEIAQTIAPLLSHNFSTRRYVCTILLTIILSSWNSKSVTTAFLKYLKMKVEARISHYFEESHEYKSLTFIPSLCFSITSDGVILHDDLSLLLPLLLALDNTRINSVESLTKETSTEKMLLSSDIHPETNVKSSGSFFSYLQATHEFISRPVENQISFPFTSKKSSKSTELLNQTALISCLYLATKGVLSCIAISTYLNRSHEENESTSLNFQLKKKLDIYLSIATVGLDICHRGYKNFNKYLHEKILHTPYTNLSLPSDYAEYHANLIVNSIELNRSSLVAELITSSGSTCSLIAALTCDLSTLQEYLSSINEGIKLSIHYAIDVVYRTCTSICSLSAGLKFSHLMNTDTGIKNSKNIENASSDPLNRAKESPFFRDNTTQSLLSLRIEAFDTLSILITYLGEYYEMLTEVLEFIVSELLALVKEGIPQRLLSSCIGTISVLSDIMQSSRSTGEIKRFYLSAQSLKSLLDTSALLGENGNVSSSVFTLALNLCETNQALCMCHILLLCCNSRHQYNLKYKKYDGKYTFLMLNDNDDDQIWSEKIYDNIVSEILKFLSRAYSWSVDALKAYDKFELNEENINLLIYAIKILFRIVFSMFSTVSKDNDSTLSFFDCLLYHSSIHETRRNSFLKLTEGCLKLISSTLYYSLKVSSAKEVSLSSFLDLECRLQCILKSLRSQVDKSDQCISPELKSRVESIESILFGAKKILETISFKKVDRLSKLKRRAQREESDYSDDDSESEDDNIKRQILRPRRTRKLLRSRNPVIDSWLAAEGSSENYADLEDFLVE